MTVKFGQMSEWAPAVEDLLKSLVDDPRNPIVAAPMVECRVRALTSLLQADTNAQAAQMLAGQLHAMNEASGAQTKALTRWTKVMAFATVALVLTAIGQMIVMLLNR